MGGLGSDCIIGSLSMGSKRTFYIESMRRDPKSGRKIQFAVPLIHGCFLVMGAGFQKYWLHRYQKRGKYLEIEYVSPFENTIMPKTSCRRWKKQRVHPDSLRFQTGTRFKFECK